MEALDTVAWMFWSIGVVVVIVATLGSLLPLVPGTPLLFAVALLIGMQHGWDHIWWPLGIAALTTVLALVMDYLGTMLGAKLGGGGQAAIWGSLIGLILAVLGLLPTAALGEPLLGIILGPILGAWLGEVWSRTRAGSIDPWREAVRPAMGTLVGGIVGTLVKTLLTLGAGIWMLVVLWP
jgi:uncharacterized protein YqgC (DUF456 family)